LILLRRCGSPAQGCQQHSWTMCDDDSADTLGLRMQHD
jgi:hypothetical protein